MAIVRLLIDLSLASKCTFCLITGMMLPNYNGVTHMTVESHLPETLTTPRLRWRGMQDTDIDVIYRQFSDLDMCACFSDPPCSMSEAIEIIHHYADMRKTRSLRYATFSSDTGAFIGTCGYHFYETTTKQLEIGYDVWKNYWRQGYASEMLEQLIKLCTVNLGVTKIYALIGLHNSASQATVRKFGFIPGDFLRAVSDIERHTTACWHLDITE